MMSSAVKAEATAAVAVDPAITFVNRFVVHGPTGEFERTFAQTSDFMCRQPGFLRHTLVRHVTEPAAYVNIAHWSDEESFRRALEQPEFAAHASALRALSRTEPNLYRTLMRRESAPADQDRQADLAGAAPDGSRR